MSEAFSALLLAGGASRRMGIDKAFLDWEGKPLWEHQVATLRAVGPGEILVARGAAPLLPDDSLIHVADEGPPRGPLSGVAAALVRASFPRLLVLAIDLPAMRSELLARLLETSTHNAGAVFRGETFFEPLAAVYPTRLAETARMVLSSPDHSMQAFIRTAVDAKALAPEPIPSDARDAFRNLNRPGDLSPE